MTALYIIAAIVAVLLFLLFSRVYITLGYSTAAENGLSLDASYLFLRFKILPKKAKKIKLRDYSYKNFQKSEKKRLAKEKEDRLRKSKKVTHGQSAKKAEERRTNEKKNDRDEKKNAVSMIWELRGLILNVLGSFISQKLRLDISRIHINVGGKDAAVTAITYGLVTEAVGALLAALEDFIHIKRRYENEVMITPDFTSQRLDADILVRISVTPAGVLSAAVSLIRGYISKIVKNNLKI